jgi:predicted Mrr-cat superfamily restriction endonuclease
VRVVDEGYWVESGRTRVFEVGLVSEYRVVFAQNIIIVEAAHDVQTMQERQRREMLGCRHEEREM